jgi:hypothetical protein
MEMWPYSRQASVAIDCSIGKLHTWPLLNEFSIGNWQEGQLSVFGIDSSSVRSVLKDISILGHETLKNSFSSSIGATCEVRKCLVNCDCNRVVVVPLLRKIRTRPKNLAFINILAIKNKLRASYTVEQLISYGSTISHRLQHHRTTTCI